MNRRNLLKKSMLAAGSLMASSHLLSLAQELKNKTILVVSGWQYHNIGDIAHTPGLLKLLNTFLPETHIILWPNHEVRSIDEMLMSNFPDLEIVNGGIDNGQVHSEAVLQASENADFLLHGSGPMIVGHQKINWWKKKYNKPYGIYGVTVGNPNEYNQRIINDAAFIFTRETQSLERIKEAGTTCEIQNFGPDATFAMHLHDEVKAVSFMKSKKLEPKQFICVVPRLRKTPYYKIYPEWGWTPERIKEIDDLNQQHAEIDHAKAREAIITWIRQTGNKVLVCPEMTYQIEIMQELLFDPLPADVKQHVELRDEYWLCDEAATVYKNAFAVLSFECHSPIISCFNGTPAFYLRQPEDTIKGQMWYDIGLNDWIFEIEETTGQMIAQALMDIYDNTKTATKYLENAMDMVRSVQFNNYEKIKNIMNT
jgi:polysaccharide pyruvyl transferase WcaK-like protein